MPCDLILADTCQIAQVQFDVICSYYDCVALPPTTPSPKPRPKSGQMWPYIIIAMGVLLLGLIVGLPLYLTYGCCCSNASRTTLDDDDESSPIVTYTRIGGQQQEQIAMENINFNE
jgi:hypothetical protein